MIRRLLLLFIVVLNCTFVTPYPSINLVDEEENNSSEDFPRIIGGNEVTIEKAPYTVGLINTVGVTFCGGVVIAPRLVITAQHCVTRYAFNEIRVVGAVTNMPEWSENENAQVVSSFSKKTRKLKICISLMLKKMLFFLTIKDGLLGRILLG